jgi:phage tail sheath gpL-like
MTVTPSSLAAGNLASAKNVQFAVEAQVLTRKLVIIGAKDPLKTGLAVNTPRRVLSAEEVGDLAGFGFMLHRLSVRAFEGSQGVETWIIPQSEDGAAVVADGEIDWTGSTGVEAGTIALYIAGLRVPVSIAAGATVEDISDAVVAAVNADVNLPVTAAKTAVTFETTFDSKTKGLWGNDIDISFNLLDGEELPTGVTAVITDMANGTTVPDITGALNAMGTTGTDSQNEKFFTELIHGYGQDTTTLDAISSYNGISNDFTGNYKKEIARPFRTMTGDTVAGSGGFTGVTALGDGRKETDRTNGVIAAPGSQNHPSEIAAWALGDMAKVNSNRAEETYIDRITPFFGGDVADRWTDDYDNRDSAVKSGVSTTQVKNGVLTLQNMVTFYHPDSVAQSSNGYRAQRNISVIQNILYNYKLNFDNEKWKGISIVEDKTAVTDLNDRQKARDIDDVIDDLVALAFAFAGKAWLYTASFTIAELQQGDKVQIRAGVTGFDIIFPIILSGEGGIFNSEIQFDTSIAILL